MKFLLFAVRDVKSGIYLTPFPSRSDSDAKRQIEASADDPQMLSTPIARHPEDFALHQIGAFDDETGAISAVPPVCVLEMSSVFKRRDS